MTEIKRKRYLIQKSFQLRMFFRFMVMIIFATVLTGALIIGITAYKQKKDKAKIFYVTDEFGTDPKNITETDKIKLMLPVIGLTLVASVVITGIFVMFYSHKMAGPVYRMTKCLNDANEGKLSEEIVLRKNDEFQELADACNKIIRNS